MGIWVVILLTLLMVLGFYFTLTFFENLHKNDERITKQSKTAAIICVTIALFIFFLYSI